MPSFDTYLYLISAVLQLCAMVYALRMAREVNDKRPWMLLFSALLIMFCYRIAAPHMSDTFRLHSAPIISLPISLFLFISLLSLRRVAIAERESRQIAAQRTTERDEIQNRYSSLVELSPDAVFVEADGKFVYLNAAAMAMFGATRVEEMLGRSSLEFVAMESRDAARARQAALRKIGDAAAPSAEQWIRADGVSVPVEATASVVPWKGGLANLVILRDVSERRRAEDEKTRLLENERAARALAEHASRMKDDFLATLSHELRTPLNAILGWAQILRQTDSSADDLRQGLETIERNARAQTQLIADLLDMSRITSGRLQLDIQRVPPNTFVDSAIDTMRTAAEAKNINLVTQIDPFTGPIAGDPARLQQVVWNLVSNAVKFTPRGGRVNVDVARVDGSVQIAVTDSGEGIRGEFLPYVFDRFRQADASTTRRHGGLGLGLAIVKQLVELHGGSVYAESDGEGRGARFIVMLPLAATQPTAEDPLKLPPVSEAPASLAPSLGGVTVLVVDDEPDALRLIRRVLEGCGAQVLTAESADAAINLLRLNKPAVLVSDIGMIGRDGYDLIREVRSLSEAEGGRIPAVALTAFARSEDRTRAMISGYQVHIAKPVEPDELTATVASLSGRIAASA